MNKWKRIKGIDLDILRDNRRSLHHAVQLVGAVPRNLRPHDPTDGTASLEWNSSKNALESLPVTNSVGLEITVGFAFKDFSLYLSNTGTQIVEFDMKGRSVNEGLYWLKEELDKLTFPIESLTLELPYEIEKYNSLRPLGASEDGLKEYTRLYKNCNNVLLEMTNLWVEAYDIRCWPHHFDLATLIPIKTDINSEIVESIGVGLSPGDETIDEPYLYVNVWPKIAGELLTKHQLPIGNWNIDGWSGAVLTYSELVLSNNQRHEFVGFINFAINAIQTELKVSTL